MGSSSSKSEDFKSNGTDNDKKSCNQSVKSDSVSSVKIFEDCKIKNKLNQSSSDHEKTPIKLISNKKHECPICFKKVNYKKINIHVEMCLKLNASKYNVENLSENANEDCVVCFESMKKDDKVARLPCWCIYHQKCIDEWYIYRRVCPSHPDTDMIERNYAENDSN
ncbi:E3 ubiquitin-protein ligase znrf1 [Intoshia linei]|uniref:RING-type E3 ubiquitin transferase n=1 Tax=Intoshia linei TaxID=1819745 RepID=A0A177BDC6_9BILA|nr:E3 ubiquitin-protein ligase znrf1 [Intoshia linei]